MFAALKRFDVYRDVPKDLTEQTLTGALVSLLCGAAVVFLFLSEFIAFVSVETVSEMFVDADVDHHNHATISIRMNFTVPRLPCAGQCRLIATMRPDVELADSHERDDPLLSRSRLSPSVTVIVTAWLLAVPLAQ